MHKYLFQLKIILKNKLTIVFLIMGIVMAFFSANNYNYEYGKPRLTIVDIDKSEYSKLLIENLENNDINIDVSDNLSDEVVTQLILEKDFIKNETTEIITKDENDDLNNLINHEINKIKTADQIVNDKTIEENYADLVKENYMIYEFIKTDSSNIKLDLATKMMTTYIVYALGFLVISSYSTKKNQNSMILEINKRIKVSTKSYYKYNLTLILAPMSLILLYSFSPYLISPITSYTFLQVTLVSLSFITMASFYYLLFFVLATSIKQEQVLNPLISIIAISTSALGGSFSQLPENRFINTFNMFNPTAQFNQSIKAIALETPNLNNYFKHELTTLILILILITIYKFMYRDIKY